MQELSKLSGDDTNVAQHPLALDLGKDDRDRFGHLNRNSQF